MVTDAADLFFWGEWVEGNWRLRMMNSTASAVAKTTRKLESPDDRGYGELNRCRG